ncbi:MAG: hypothetical protein IJ722_02140 [Alloprevotella sp.]|nr:hypothetical protein [Alloprevotella sp.]
MKKVLTSLTLLALAASMPLMAQEKIEKLYQRMASDPKVSINQSIQVDRKPGAEVTGKTSMCEVNSFAIHKPDKKNRYRYAEYGRLYVTDLAAAIQAEAPNPQCYRVASYNVTDRGKPRQWRLIYGDDASQYIMLGEHRTKNYIFACFADKENPGYRWCYALEWYEMGYKGDIFGRYIRLYAKMPEETSSTPKVQGIVRDNDAYDPFSMFGDGKFGTGLTINAKDRTFTLNGKTLPLDSLTSVYKELRELSPLEAELQTGGLVSAIQKSKAERVKRFLQNLNAMRARWANGDYQTDPTLPVSIYTLVKEAVEADILDKDEKELVNTQLVSMAEQTETGYGHTDACAYLGLAQKLLQRSK